MIGVCKKILSILTADEKKNACYVLFMILLMGIFESAGVASIAPLLIVLTNPGATADNHFISGISETLGVTHAADHIHLFSGIVVAVVLVGLFVKIITYWSLSKFAHMRNYSLSVRLLCNYLNKPYAWFLERNTTDLHKMMLSEVQIVVDQALIPILRLIASMTVLICLCALLLFVDLQLTVMIMTVLIGGYALIYYSVRGYLKVIGIKRVESNHVRYRVAQETLHGIKQVKSLGIEDYVLGQFSRPARSYAQHLSLGQILGEVPRFVIEVFAIVLMVVLIAVMYSGGDGELADVLPLLGLYGFAGLRLLPAVQQVYQSATKLRFSASALNQLEEELQSTSDNNIVVDAETGSKDTVRDNQIMVTSLDYRYSGANQAVFSGLDISIGLGQTIGIVGKTGSGKTTFVDLLLGLLQPQEGEITVDGRRISDDMAGWRKNIGYVPQQVLLLDDTIEANIAFGVDPDMRDSERIVSAAKVAMIHDFIVNELDDGYQTIVGERGIRISGGQSQRIAFARALYRDPDILVLDEATSALDTVTESKIIQSLRVLGKTKTIIIIAHRLSTVRYCDTIIMLEKGKVIGRGSYDDLIQTCKQFTELVNVSCE